MNKRKYDIKGRAYLESIAVGIGLDIGCSFKKINENCLGVDIDPECNPSFVSEMSDLSFSCGNFYDFVVSSHCLEHSADTVKTLKEWFRVIRKGGKIGVLVPHGDYVSYKSLGDAGGSHKQLFTPDTLKKYLMHVGFKKVKIIIVKRPYAWKQHPAIVAIGKKP